MKEQIVQLESEIAAVSISDKSSLEAFKRDYVGKSGAIQALFDQFKSVPNEQKREVGALLNQLKGKAQQRFDEALEALESQVQAVAFDYTAPGYSGNAGSRHPLESVRLEIEDIFKRIGFALSDGPEIEDDWHNFTALNFPEDHPARDMQDTFFTDENGYLLRTHTSPVQVRTMLSSRPPIRIISPGRVYRCDSDATHSPVFHQVEGLYIDEQVSFADLKECLYYFVQAFFGKSLKVRFRPSFFPFTEPSAEMDIAWQTPSGERWMEILGCGMIDPNVLTFAGIDPEKYQGFAFGVGVERMTMLRHQIRDIRAFYDNDVRFLRQF